MSISSRSPSIDTLDQIVEDIEKLIKGYDGCDDEISREHVAGLQEALDVVRARADRLR